MSTAKKPRARIVSVRVDAIEGTRLDDLCKHYGLSASSVVRMVVKRAHDAWERTSAASIDPAVWAEWKRKLLAGSL